MTKILLIDDDRSLLRALEIGLGAKGYETAVSATGKDGLTQTVLFSPDLILLDMGLPDIDGIQFCRQLRSYSETPILVLSAAEDETRKVDALDAGADDYVTKPFGMAELDARIRVALRHARNRADPDRATLIRVGNIAVDLERRQVTNAEVPIELTAREFDLLLYLAKNSGKVYTHHQILRDIWGRGYGEETHYLRVYINRLRKKLNDPNGKMIRTKPGIGYQLLDTTEDS
ncbi:MAG: response regulator transcription factor [Actinomycetota bacterium]|jgi:two-component system KDP operon response regulator KdpE|nr:response regulator transcription factor [Actinomycetota bacterium]